MAIELSATAEALSQKSIIEPMLILEIDGIDQIFGSFKVYKMARYGEDDIYFGQPGLYYGRGLLDPNQRDFISLRGSTTTLTQQMMQDRGGTGSVTSMTIELIDKLGEITRLITPGLTVEEIISRRARVYLNFKGGVHPEDSTQIFNGLIDNVDAGAGVIRLTVAHPDQLRRTEIFQKVSTLLAADVNYRAATIQGIVYQTRKDATENVSITYIGGGTKDSEVVTVVSGDITVQIQAGVSTASSVRRAVEQSPQATALVSLSIVKDQSGTLQNTQAQTFLNSDVTIAVDSTENFLLPGDALKTYIRINDEIMEYTTIIANSFVVSREQLNTDGATHFVGDTVESYYRLQGQCIDLALKIMLSGAPSPFITDQKIKSFVRLNNDYALTNAIFFKHYNIADKLGVTAGDKITVTGSVSNNIIDAVISGSGTFEGGSYLTVTGVTLVEETTTTTAIASFKSRYNVLNDGLGMTPMEVDVEKHIELFNLWGSNFFAYDFYLKEAIKGAEFINEQIYFPSGLYYLPRRGRVSCGVTMPPLALGQVKRIDESNILNASDLKLNRTSTKYFYNSVVYKYNPDSIDDRFLSGKITLSADSTNRIKLANKPMVIEASGIREDGDTQALIALQTRRFLDRYKFAAESVSPQVNYKTGFNLDIGDIVIFGSETLQLPDSKVGTNAFQPRLMEIVNKSMSLKTGVVTLTLVDTNYSLNDGRYGVIAPSSRIETGATTSRLPLKKSFGTPDEKEENYKWQNLKGEIVAVRSRDFVTYQETTFIGFDGTLPNTMIVDPPLGFVPADGYIVDPPYYYNAGALWKAAHVFFNPAVAVASGISNFSFTVAPGDAAKFVTGQPVLIHSEDWATVSFEAKISTVAGVTITVNNDLGFTPSPGQVIDLIGFTDSGKPYRIL